MMKVGQMFSVKEASEVELNQIKLRHQAASKHHQVGMKFFGKSSKFFHQNHSQRKQTSSAFCLVTILSYLCVGSLAQHHQVDATPTTMMSSNSRFSWSLMGEDNWNYWWSYSGVSGPAYWGLLNLDWFLCDKGRRQSPINIETNSLVYDPNLTPMKISDKNLISGLLYNDGHSIVFNGSISSKNLLLNKQNNEMNQVRASKISSNNDNPLDVSGLNKNVSRRNAVVVTSRQGDNIMPLDNFILDDSQFDQSSDRANIQMLQRSDELSNEIIVGTNSNGQTDERKSERPLKENNQAISQSADEVDDVDGDSIVQQPVQFSGAGLAYTYDFEALQLHFGQASQAASSLSGSEHSINMRHFVAELQLFGYNSNLYKNYHEASTRTSGLLAVAILIELLPQHLTTNEGAKVQLNGQLERLLDLALASIVYRGQFVPLAELNLTALLPETDQFVTYEGSLTQPGCYESVTWLVLNKPLYITKQSLDKLKTLSADEQSASNPSGSLLAGNTRPIQPINSRPLRTNIRPSSKQTSLNEPKASCPRLWTRYNYIQPKVV